MLIGEKVPHLGGPGVVHPHGTIHELDPIRFASLNDDIKLGGVESNRLLEKQVLLLLGNEDSPVDMQAGGQGHVDGIDVWIVKDALIGTVDLHIGREVIG